MANVNLDRDATSSASPSHGNPNSYVYDVFLNHRGPDVKKTLASHIYLRLKQQGLAVFLDQQELQEGENMTPQIEGAIRTASVHVAIFSPRYAESSWCLKELEQMLESGVDNHSGFLQCRALGSSVDAGRRSRLCSNPEHPSVYARPVYPFEHLRENPPVYPLVYHPVDAGRKWSVCSRPAQAPKEDNIRSSNQQNEATI
jgi:hypothetical protein